MKKYTSILILLLFIAVFTTCKKEPDAPVGGNKIEMGETKVDTVSYFEAKVSSSLASTGGNEIIQHGHCWSTKNKPTTDDFKTTLGKLDAPKSYASQLTGLKESTIYYVRSYITYKYGTLYGDEQNMKTLKTGKPLVNTTEVTDVTLYSAKCSGDVLADSGLFVTTRGVCWDTTNIFTITDCLDTTIVGSGTGSFTSNITALNEGVKYFVKAYANNEKGTSYGEVIQFTTVPITLPEVSTSVITDISINSATSGGNVISNGTVTARGTCWNTTGNPTLQNSLGYTTDGSGTGSFTSEITGLNNGVTYFVSAYATNEKVTSYGDVKQFETLSITLPEITTNETTEITINSAKSGGNVTSSGNGTVIARGVCWNTTGSPTIENNIGFTSNGSGTGTFTSQLTELIDNTIYYVAAYATNEEGTVYGHVKDFLTPSYFTDPRDGKTYETVIIGSQTWFAENLNYGTSNSWYYNSSTNGDTYGRLYTWDAAVNACPDGWHLPGDDEWKTLEMHLGMSQSEANAIGLRGNDEGKKLKSTSGWNSGGNGTDAVGFIALPGGYSNAYGDFFRLGSRGYWWSATEYNSSLAWYRSLNYEHDQIRRNNYAKDNGSSVRCVRD